MIDLIFNQWKRIFIARFIHIEFSMFAYVNDVIIKITS